MMNRRAFMRWLGFAPAAAIVAVALPKIVRKGDGPVFKTKVWRLPEDYYSRRWDAKASAEYGRQLENEMWGTRRRL